MKEVREAVPQPVEPARTGGGRGGMNGSANGNVRGSVYGTLGRVRPTGVSLLRPAPGSAPDPAARPPGIKDWPEPERPREKLLRKGPEALSDAELVALFVRSGTRGRNAVDVAREGLAAAGGLRRLLDLEREELCRLAGFGPARYAELQACLELGRRHLAAPLDRGKPLVSTDAASRFLMAKLRRHPFEVFACLFLDTRHRVIEFEEMFRGTLDTTSVHSREVVRRCLDLNAGAVIFAHNHPSGSAEPSKADELITKALVEALMGVGVKVLDHLVIGDAEFFSFADRGLI